MSDGVTLGELAVAIGGDLTPLLAKLEEARRIVDAFDRDMAAGSGGMLRFTESSKTAGAALDSQSIKATAAAKAITDAADRAGKLTDANKNLAASSKAATDALEGEAQKNERLASVIDRTIARMADQNRLTMARTGPLAGITSAGIPAGYVASSGAQDAMMGTIGGKMPPGVLSGATDAAAIGVATKAVKDEAVAVEELGSKTKISSLSIREIIVLMREMGRGDFTRMAGSASLLGQNLGLIEKIGLGNIVMFGGLAAAVGFVAVELAEGSAEATRFNNEMKLSGNFAGFTADSYEKMAERIGASTKTSIESNKSLIGTLATTNKFTIGQIESLVTASQQLSKATGESADKILSEFARIADGPTKYAEEFQRTHIGVIQPLQMQAIKDAEKRGDTETAQAMVIKIATDEIAANAVANTNIIVRAWRSASQAVSDFVHSIREASAANTPLEQLHVKLNNINAALSNPQQANRDTLLQLKARTEQEIANLPRLAEAKAKDAQATQRQAEAIDRIDSTYSRVDGPTKYREAIARLNTTLADSLKMARETPIGTLLSAAAKSGISSIRDLGNNYAEQVDRIKKQNLPNQYRADAKAAREAAAAAKKLENEAEALERRRQQEIDSLKDMAATLEAIAPLYFNQSASLEEVNRAKAITTALTREKLTAEEAEGRVIAQLVGHNYDLEAAIKAETKAREARDKIEKDTRDLQAQTATHGTSRNPTDASQQTEAYRALEDALQARRELAQHDRDSGLTSEQGYQAALTAIQRDGEVAREKLDQDVSNQDAARRADNEKKFFEALEQNTAKIKLETAAIGEGKETEDLAIIRAGMMNEAKQKHIELTAENIARIEQEARSEQHARQGFNRATLIDEYNPHDKKVTGQDIHGLAQTLGGSLGQQDSLKALEANIKQQQKIAATARAADILNEKQYQETLRQITADGLLKRLQIRDQMANLELTGAISIADSLASIASDGFGKQSKIYRALFDVSKAFTIAKAALAMEEDIAAASSKGFPANIPLIAAAAAEGAQIISAIKSISLSFAAGGFVSGAGTGTSDSIPANLSNGEFVTNAQATAQWRPMLEAINAGRMPTLSEIPSAANDSGPRVTIHNHAPGVVHEARQLGPNDIEIIARKVVRQEAPGVVAADMSRPNSKTSKVLTRHTTTRRQRP